MPVELATRSERRLRNKQLVLVHLCEADKPSMWVSLFRRPAQFSSLGLAARTSKASCGKYFCHVNFVLESRCVLFWTI